MWHASRLDPRGSRHAPAGPLSCMRRYVLIILGVLVAAWAALAIVLGSPTLNTSSSSNPVAASPPCPPASPGRSAQRAGAAFYAPPAPATDPANPRTQISFMGAPAGSIGTVSAVGSA